MIVTAVLNKSRAFDERHVLWLGRQVAKHMPEARFLPFADVPLPIDHVQVRTDLTDWWMKMEIARHGLEEPVLVLDLDMVLLGPIPVKTVPTVLRHPIAPNQLACGLMVWTPDFAHDVSRHFFSWPRYFVAEANNDDQRYYLRYFGDRLERYQDQSPDVAVSYKYTVKPWGLRPNNRLVFFHGYPRPWEANDPWIPPLEES